MSTNRLAKTVVLDCAGPVKESKEASAFGYQLLLDLYDCKSGACDDLALCYRFLDEIVEYLGMEKQAPPGIFYTDAKRFPDKAGLSGWAQIHDYDAPRGGADVARTQRKLSFDLYYLKHRSFGLDLAIAIKTLRTLLSFSGT